ncbi:MAG: TonB-dependent receptor, partial [Chitinophagaceae bacterium]
IWLDYNPIRRTNSALYGVDKESSLWNEIVNQTRLKGQATLDFFAGYSYKLPRKKGAKHNEFIVFNVGINNILNNQNIITGGFEQLRFDFDAKNVNRFPPKLFYAYGTNFFASIIYRLQ